MLINFFMLSSFTVKFFIYSNFLSYVKKIPRTVDLYFILCCEGDHGDYKKIK